MGDGTPRVPSGGRRFLAGLSRLLARHAIALTPEQLSLAEGARAAVVTALLLAPALSMHRPTLAWMAFAGFWACLIDPGGETRQRVKIFGGLTVGGAVALCLSAWASQGGLPAVFAIIVLAGLATGFGRAGPPAIAQLILLVSAVACAGTGFARPFGEALQLAASFVTGGLFASLLCLVVWRLHPYTPARRALAAVYRALELMIAELAAARLRETVHRQAVRHAIERARGLAAQIDAQHANAVMRARLEAGLGSAERVFTALLAIEHLFEMQGLTEARRSVLSRLSALCRASEIATRQVAPQTGLLLTGSRALIDDLATRADSLADSYLALVRLCAEAFLGLAHALDRQDAPRAAPGTQGAWRITPAIVRHAARLVIALVLTEALCLGLAFSFAFWALIAAMIVVQPVGASTLARSVERVIGSLLGAALAAGLASLLAGHLGALLGVTAVLALLAIALRGVNYTLLVLFLTALFVLVAELVMPGDGFALYRAVDNSLGAMVGLFCALTLWPDRGQRQLEAMLRAALAGNLEYAGLSLSGRDDPATLSRIAGVQRSAGMVMVDAEFAQGGLPLLGGLGGLSFAGSNGRQASAILRALRRLSGEATLRRFDIATGFRTPDRALSDRFSAWAARIEAEEPGAFEEARARLIDGELFALLSGAGVSDQAEPGESLSQGGR